MDGPICLSETGMYWDQSNFIAVIHQNYATETSIFKQLIFPTIIIFGVIFTLKKFNFREFEQKKCSCVTWQLGGPKKALFGDMINDWHVISATLRGNDSLNPKNKNNIKNLHFFCSKRTTCFNFGLSRIDSNNCSLGVWIFETGASVRSDAC